MVDAADREKIEASRNELHNLLDKPQLQGIPVRNCLWSLDQKLWYHGPDLALHIDFWGSGDSSHNQGLNP